MHASLLQKQEFLYESFLLLQLLLQTFAEPVKFNPDFDVFEVVNDTPQCLENQLKKILHDQKPPSPIYDVTRKAKNDGQLSKKSSIFPVFSVDPNYSIMVSLLRPVTLYLNPIILILTAVTVVFGLLSWEKC